MFKLHCVNLHCQRLGINQIGQDMQKYLIKNIQVVNEGTNSTADVLIKNGRIEKIAAQITSADTQM